MKSLYVSIGVPVMAAMFTVSAILISCGSGEIIEIANDFNMDGFGYLDEEKTIESKIGGQNGFISRCFGITDKGGAGSPTSANDQDCRDNYVTDKPLDPPEPPPPPPGSSSSGDNPLPPPPGGSSSSSEEPPPPPSGDVICGALPRNGTAGVAVTPPNVYCGSDKVTDIRWSDNAPNWSNPAVGSYSNVTATIPCGGTNKTANCGGELTVTAAGGGGSSSSGGGDPGVPTLTCTGLLGTGTANQPITPPAVSCGGATLTGNAISWTGAPASWTSPAVGNYTISAAAASGSCAGLPAVPCGLINVTAAAAAGELKCVGSNLSTTVNIALPQAQRPTAQCDGSTVTATWAPSNFTWSTAGAQNLTATASCGGSSKTATCSVTVTAAQTGGCGYQPSWCNNIAIGQVVTTAQNISGSNDAIGKCYYATSITDARATITINGTKFQDGCEASGVNWGRPLCSGITVAKVDGGYYIYVDSHANSFITVNSSNGLPSNCK